MHLKFLLASLAVLLPCFIHGENDQEADRSESSESGSLKFHSPDGNITLIVSNKDRPSDGSDPEEPIGSAIVQVMDKRNDGVYLPLPVFGDIDLPFEGEPYCTWYWDGSLVQFGFVDVRSSLFATYVLRMDVRSGVHYFEEVSPPFGDLQRLILEHTNENRDALEITPDSDYHFGGSGEFRIQEEIEGHFVLTLGVAAQGGDHRDQNLLHYAFTFHTPDWIRFELLKIERIVDQWVPSEAFIEPDKDYLLLYKK